MKYDKLAERIDFITHSNDTNERKIQLIKDAISEHRYGISGKKLVPLGPWDVPPGSAVRYSHRSNKMVAKHAWTLVSSVGMHGIIVEEDVFTYERMMKELEISRDGGKTWHHCEKPQD